MATNKKNKRSRTKYPALDISCNPKNRKDYMDTEYVKGVKDSNGTMVIRPLNDDEVKWLNQYYDEFVHTNFKKEDTMCDDVVERRKYYTLNNIRNRCIYNISKSTGTLIESDAFDNVEDMDLSRSNTENYNECLIDYIEMTIKDWEF